MPRSLALILALLLASSLALKASAGPVRRSPDLPGLLRQLEVLARADGYAVEGVNLQIAAPLLGVRHGPCRRRLFALDPFGGLAPRMRSLREPGEAVFFHYGSRTLAEAPRTGPAIGNYAQAYALAMGVDLPATPVVGELRSGDCRAAPPIPFTRLRTRLISS